MSKLLADIRKKTPVHPLKILKRPTPLGATTHFPEGGRSIGVGLYTLFPRSGHPYPVADLGEGKKRRNRRRKKRQQSKQNNHFPPTVIITLRLKRNSLEDVSSYNMLR